MSDNIQHNGLQGLISCSLWFGQVSNLKQNHQNIHKQFICPKWPKLTIYFLRKIELFIKLGLWSPTFHSIQLPSSWVFCIWQVCENKDRAKNSILSIKQDIWHFLLAIFRLVSVISADWIMCCMASSEWRHCIYFS